MGLSNLSLEKIVKEVPYDAIEPLTNPGPSATQFPAEIISKIENYKV